MGVQTTLTEKLDAFWTIASHSSNRAFSETWITIGIDELVRCTVFKDAVNRICHSEIIRTNEGPRRSKTIVTANIKKMHWPHSARTHSCVNQEYTVFYPVPSITQFRRAASFKSFPCTRTDNSHKSYCEP